MPAYNGTYAGIPGWFEGEGPTPGDLAKLHRAADLSLRVTKKMARAIGRSMAAMKATERHLWLNLSGIKEKDRAFLLDAPISPSGLVMQSIQSLTGFRRRKSSLQHLSSTSLAALNLRRMLRVGGPSRHQAPRTGRYKKESVASRAPPEGSWQQRRYSHPKPAEPKVNLRTSFRQERLRERVPSSRRASESCPPWGGANQGCFHLGTLWKLMVVSGRPLPFGPHQFPSQWLEARLRPFLHTEKEFLSFPASIPLQGFVNDAWRTPEVSLGRLIPLVDYIGNALRIYHNESCIQ